MAETMTAQEQQLQAENRELRAQLAQYRRKYESLRRRELLEHLLSGDYLDAEQVVRELDLVGIHLNCDDHILLAIHVLSGGHPDGNIAELETESYYGRYEDRVEALVTAGFQPEYPCGVIHMGTGSYVFLGIDEKQLQPPGPADHVQEMIPPEHDFINDISRRALTLYDRIRETLGLEVFIAISRPCAGIENLQKAQLDTKTIFDYSRFLQLDVPVLCYHDFEMSDDCRRNTFDTAYLEKEYAQDLDRRDFDAARSVMHRLLELDGIHSVEALRTIRIRTMSRLNELLLAIDRINDSEEAAAIYESTLASVEKIEDGSMDMQALSGTVDAVFDRLHALTGRQEHPKTQPWISGLLDYVRDNHRNAELNVNSISEHYHMNPTYLSAGVKEATGDSLFNYIQKHRLKTACRLLGGGMPLPESAVQSGFGDVRSMRRAFKKHLNCTPSEYNAEP